MFSLPNEDTRTRHLAAGVIRIMMQEDFIPADHAKETTEALTPLWIASRVWSLSDWMVGFPVLFDTVTKIIAFDYVKRLGALNGMFGFRRGLRENISDWIAKTQPSGEGGPLLPMPLFQFFRHTVPLPQHLRDMALRTTGVISSVENTVRIGMVEVSPFSAHGVAMMSRMDGPEDQFSGAGIIAAGLTPQIRSSWQPELEQSIADRSALRIDPIHGGMSIEAVQRIADDFDIASMLARANEPFEPVPSLRAERNRRVLEDAVQFRAIANRVMAEMGDEHRKATREASAG